MLQRTTLPRPQTIGTWLFPFILGATVLQNYFDIEAIFNGSILNLTAYEGPIIFKLLKDILYLTLLATITWIAIQTRRLPVTMSSLAFGLVMFISFMISVTLNDLTIAAIGLRWAIPFVIFLLERDLALRVNPKRGTFWLLFGMLACLCAQIFELFYMPPIYGEIFGGWPARTPGFFLAPNSTAFFACSCCACISVFAHEQYRIRLIAACVALAICLLAQSGTGIVTATVLLIWIAKGRFNLQSMGIATIMGALVFLNLNTITMRDDFVAVSGGNRVDVFIYTVSIALTSIGNFGIYTNAGTLQENAFAINFAADSLWASWFGNFGILALLQLAFVAVFVWKNMKLVNWHAAFPCVLVFLLFSMTTIIFEAFPMNLLLGIGIWSSHNVPRRIARSALLRQSPTQQITIDGGAL
ncbi:hypothetical protein [Undibacterium sp.]|uniref:hypothetical protein n=1 Tax=Undibacterium sp. TaxID=1914977 RepID=UPI003750C085